VEKQAMRNAIVATKEQLYSLAGFEKTITFCTLTTHDFHLGASNSRPSASSVITHTGD
jgi:hypothetical protein